MAGDESMMDVSGGGDDDDMVFEEEGGIRIGDIYIPPPPPPALTFDATGPRLIIASITNENFKSFFGKHVLGPFHKSFTSIVGPNGSGKSNCIDSMLFVFGHRAQKIRSKKVGALIHNSEQHRNVESCTVKVHFKKILDLPGDDYEDVPGSEFVISRTAMRDNSSFYCIDDRRCQFKDVALKLRSQGIDIDHNRFLILQGEVEQISMMKPKALNEHDVGMLEYLEDIVGSVRFKVPIEKLAQKVEELNEQRTEKLNRVKVVEKEKDDMEDVKNEALEYIKLENEATKYKNILYHYYIYDNTLKSTKSNEQKGKVDVIMKELLDGLKELESVQKDVDKEMKKHSIAYEKIQKTLEEAKAKFSEYENQDVRCREDMKHTHGKEKKLAINLNKEKKNLADLETKPAENENKAIELKAERADLEKIRKQEEEAFSKVMNSLHLETKDLQEEKDQHEAKLMNLKKQVDETKSKMDLAQSEFDIYMSNEQTEKTKLSDMQEKIKTITSKLEERSRGIKDMESKIPKVQESLKSGLNELANISTDETTISQKLHSKRFRVEEARSTFQASRSQNKVLNAVMQEKNSGNIDGIFGRLGDLGAINDKYDVAISTACGPLDYIVTDTIDTAQICVDFLKRNNIGMATFIGLDKMEKWIPYTKKTITTPEGVPRLFDLVQVKDEKLLPAFYYALRDTLVADSLDQATRIAFSGNTRYRVVTLQGHLIEQSGTMSGGGTRVNKGRMGSKILNVEFTPDQIDEMTREVENLSRRLNDLKTRKTNLEETVELQSREINELKQMLERYKLEFQELQQQQSSLNVQEKEQAARAKAAAPDQRKVKELQKTLGSKKEAYDTAASAASKVEADVQKLHKQIMVITDGRMKGAQKKLDNINKQIDDIDVAITKTEVAKKTTERNIKKTTTKITNMENEVKENAEKLMKLKEENQKIEEEAGKLVDIIAESKEKREECEKKMKIIKEESRKLQESENELNSRKVDVGHELEQVTIQLRDHNNKINSWKKELKKLVLQPTETGEVEKLEEPSKEQLENINSRDLQFQISVCEEKYKEMKPNLAAIAEYKKKEALYLQRVAELEAITEQRDSQRQMHENLRKQRLQDFLTGFGIITSKLKEMYQMITLGGDAELELVDTLDPFAGGIVFSVRPPKKSWKNISNLSGGEKTLSSLALVFALHYYKPTPFYYMDEIDAALDFKNVSIVANYIKEQTKNAQFIIISLRNNMFELADCLVGIYKTSNCSKSVCIIPKNLQAENEKSQAKVQNQAVENSNLTAENTNQVAENTIA